MKKTVMSKCLSVPSSFHENCCSNRGYVTNSQRCRRKCKAETFNFSRRPRFAIFSICLETIPRFVAKLQRPKATPVFSFGHRHQFSFSCYPLWRKKIMCVPRQRKQNLRKVKRIPFGDIRKGLFPSAFTHCGQARKSLFLPSLSPCFYALLSKFKSCSKILYFLRFYRHRRRF